MFIFLFNNNDYQFCILIIYMFANLNILINEDNQAPQNKNQRKPINT